MIQNFTKDILSRLDLLSSQMLIRLSENQKYKKQFPTMQHDIVNLGEQHKIQAIKLLLTMHKF